jgi:hypothetical protein
VPFPDIVLVKGKVGEIEENYKKEGKTIVHDILRCKVPEFFLKKISRCHQIQLENETKNMFPNKFISKITLASYRGHTEDEKRQILQECQLFISFFIKYLCRTACR